MATRLTIALGVFAFVSSGTAHAVTLNQGAAACQAAVGRGLRGFKKAYVKAWEKCLDGDLKGKGCDAAKRDTVIAIAMTKANATVTGTCTDALLFDAAPNGAGFAKDCHLEGGGGEILDGPEAACDGLPVGNATQLVDCLRCWKMAELNEFLKVLYACPTPHSIPGGSDLDCGTAPGACPSATDKVTVGCLTTIAKNGLKWLLAKENAIERCEDSVRSGRISPPCPDPLTATELGAAAQKAKDRITGKCPALPPWWDECPEKTSDGASCTPIANVNDLRDCVVDTGEAIVDELVCQQYPGTSGCPTTTTTTTTTTTLPACCGFANGGPKQLRFETTVGTGDCGTVPVGTGAVNLRCGGLYFGGSGETVPLPQALPDKGVSFFKITSCDDTAKGLTLARTVKTDPGVSIRTCTDPTGICTAAAPGTCDTNTFTCTGSGICTSGTCTRGLVGLSCSAGPDCDFDCGNDHDCDMCTAGNVGAHCNTLKGGDHQCSCLFGPPLPIPNAGVPNASTCVINTIGNQFNTTISGSGDCVAGTSTVSLPLNSEVYLTADLLPKRCSAATTGGLAGASCSLNANCPGGFCGSDPAIQPCPICNPTTLKCNGGPNEGASCTPGSSAVSSAFPTSHDCPPPHVGAEVGGVPMPFSLTTGTASKTSFSTGSGNSKSNIFCGLCKNPLGGFQNPPTPANGCTSDAQCTTPPFTSCEQNLNGAFGHPDADTITEVGEAAGDLSDGAQHNSTLVSVFCISPFYDSMFDTNWGFPGPGAVSLPGTAQLLP